jgi:putative oxidoreductase
MDVAFLIGRLLFAAIFVFSGLTVHLIGYREGVGYARAAGSPLPEIGVPLTGAIAVAGGALVALGVWADLGALMIAAFLVVITPIMHAFWRETEAQMRQIQTVMFMKNLAMLGGALILFYAYNQLQGDAGLSITDPLFGRGG